jgi:hypothetical protein
LIDPPGDVEQPRSPLRLYEKGVWHPAEQYRGEPDDMLELCLVEVIAAGPRLQFEFEQLLPGGKDPDARDPILDAIELRDRGYPELAYVRTLGRHAQRIVERGGRGFESLSGHDFLASSL